jgi:type III secretion protein J
MTTSFYNAKIRRRVCHLGYSLICTLTLLLSACDNRDVALLNGLPEDEANMIVATLVQADIGASKTMLDGTANIYVSNDQQSAALSELAQQGLPRKNYASLGEIFKKDGIISTPVEEQARYVYALAQELEKTLSQLDSVVYVRVHPVLSRKASLNGPAASASAGVLIKHRPDADLAYLVPQIRELVAHSIPDLRAEQVSIIMADAVPPTISNRLPQQSEASVRLTASWWLVITGLIVIGGSVGVYLKSKRHRQLQFLSRSMASPVERNE